MSTIIMKQEVEATPQLIAEQLFKFAAPMLNAQFPYAPQTLIELKPEILTAINGVPAMPALVVATGKGSPLGVVAVHKADGDITVFYASEAQVKGPFVMPAQVPSS